MTTAECKFSIMNVGSTKFLNRLGIFHHHGQVTCGDDCSDVQGSSGVHLNEKNEKPTREKESLSWTSTNPIQSALDYLTDLNLTYFRCRKPHYIPIKARRPLRKYPKDLDDLIGFGPKKQRADTDLVLLRIVVLIVMYYTLLMNVKKTVAHHMDIPELLI